MFVFSPDVRLPISPGFWVHNHDHFDSVDLHLLDGIEGIIFAGPNIPTVCRFFARLTWLVFSSRIVEELTTVT